MKMIEQIIKIRLEVLNEILLEVISSIHNHLKKMSPDELIDSLRVEFLKLESIQRELQKIIPLIESNKEK